MKRGGVIDLGGKENKKPFGEKILKFYLFRLPHSIILCLFLYISFVAIA
jgi:hypothetical protein